MRNIQDVILPHDDGRALRSARSESQPTLSTHKKAPVLLGRAKYCNLVQLPEVAGGRIRTDDLEVMKLARGLQ